MVKVFISQPMKGKTDAEILAERERIIMEVKGLIQDEVEIIDSFIPESAPKDSIEAVWMLGKSIQLLSEANVAYFAKGWRAARGCKIEHEVAREYGLTIIDFEN